MLKTVLLSAGLAATPGVLLAAALDQQNCFTTETINHDFDKVVTIGAAISKDENDKYFKLGGMLTKSWRLWADWVNLERGGIAVGAEKWGVKIVEIEDYSNSTFAEYAANNLVSAAGYNIDFMFGPYSSGLTGPVMDITEASTKLLFSSGSSKSTVWTTDVDYGFGMLYPSGGYYEDSMAVFEAQGAKNVAILCNSQADGNTCPTPDALLTAIDDLDMTLLFDIEIDSSASTYEADLYTALESISSSAAPVDVLILHDYSVLCVDGLQQLQDLDWTPSALYLVICNTDAAAVEEMGSAIEYATTYDSWASDGVFVSGISGYTPASFTSLFETHYEVTPTYHAASAFAAGEILVAAIEMQAGIDDTLCNDTATLASLIEGNGWSTILSAPDITFSDTHQASGEWATLQVCSSNKGLKPNTCINTPIHVHAT
jgi:branched-chain amino acid transport system substrate-binding protein